MRYFLNSLVSVPNESMEVLKTIKIWAETPHTGVVERKQMEMEFIKLGLRLQIKDERQNDGGLSPPPPKVLVFINVPKLSSACLMPVISPYCLHSLQTLEIKTSWAAWKLKEVARKTRRQGRHRWVDWWGGGGVTGYLDVLLHFALECTISGTGSQSEARFQAMVRPGAMDHLP